MFYYRKGNNNIFCVFSFIIGDFFIVYFGFNYLFDLTKVE